MHVNNKLWNNLFINLKNNYSFEKLHLGSWWAAWSQGWAWRTWAEGRCWFSWTPRASRITWSSCELKTKAENLMPGPNIYNVQCLHVAYCCGLFFPLRVLMAFLDWKAVGEPRVHLWVSLLFWELCTASCKYWMWPGYINVNCHLRMQ